MPNDWRSLFGTTEAALYERLLDFPSSDAWHIRDLLVDLKLLDAETDEDNAVAATLIAADSALSFANAQLKRNEELFPPELLREGGYPLIRQMRDVHEFDVGTHLAFCHALAIRRGPVEILRDRGFTSLTFQVQQALDESHESTPSASAVFHDFFKCFRRRRPLPSKVGRPGTIVWDLPDGERADPALAADEDRIADVLLPYFVPDQELCVQVQQAILVAGRAGKTMYDMLAVADPSEARALADNYWHREGLGRDSCVGAFLAAVDWLGKGYAQFLVTSRKQRKRTLEEAATLFYDAGERAARG